MVGRSSEHAEVLVIAPRLHAEAIEQYFAGDRCRVFSDIDRQARSIAGSEMKMPHGVLFYRRL